MKTDWKDGVGEDECPKEEYQGAKLLSLLGQYWSDWTHANCLVGDWDHLRVVKNKSTESTWS